MRPKEKGETDIRNGTNEMPWDTSENLAGEWRGGQRHGRNMKAPHRVAEQQVATPKRWKPYADELTPSG